MGIERDEIEPAPLVVLVDDDPLVLAVTRRFLQRAGYAVSPCDQARVALRMVVQTQPFALVADLHMPDMSGAELLALAQQCSPGTRRVLYTGEAQVTELARSLTPQVAEAIVAKVDGAEYLPAALDGLRTSEQGGSETGRARGVALGIARALASGHIETLDHALRLSRWARQLAGILGFSASKQLDLEAGALLHDVGMISVPLEVFRTTGTLTDLQWQQIREHPVLGEAMLRECEALVGALPVIRHHHERYDGKGYPDGLRADQIPMPARVFSVVDAYEAITHDRPHRRARSDEQARTEIFACAGVQFDPMVVEAFMSVSAEQWRRARPPGTL